MKNSTRIKTVIEIIKKWARNLKGNIDMLYLAYRHEATPWYAKLLAIITVGYALSPIDLIPDFIPVLGFIDDAILLPALIWLSLKLIPQHIIEASRERAEDIFSNEKPKNYLAGGIIILIWLAFASILLFSFLNK